MTPIFSPILNELFIVSYVDYVGKVTKVNICHYDGGYLVDPEKNRLPYMTPYWDTYRRAFTYNNTIDRIIYNIYTLAVMDDLISFKDDYDSFKNTTEVLLNTIDTKVSLLPVSEYEVNNILDVYEKKTELRVAAAIAKCDELYNSLKNREYELDKREEEIDKLEVLVRTQIACVPNLR